MTYKFDFLPNAPTLPKGTQVALSLMFYDLENNLNSSWLNWIVKVFSHYGIAPDSLILHTSSGNSSGRLENLSEKLTIALNNANDGATIDLQVRSTPIADGVGFFPTEMSLSINTSGPGKAQGVLSIRDREDRSLRDFALHHAQEIAELGGKFYGHASKFPAILGPDSYAACVGAIPKGWSFTSTQAYTNRLTAWRNHGASREHLNGYLREVFPINFLTTAHVNSNDSMFHTPSFFEKFGTLSPLGKSKDQYVWEVTHKKLPKARSEMEKAGLVLSAK
jgi:hypothetical protein